MDNDLISREALKEALHNEIGDHALSTAIDRVIDNAETVEQNWKFYYDHGYKQAERDLKRPQGDLISRNYVENIVKEEFVDLQDGTEEWRTYVNDTCENIFDKVHNAPTVEAEKILVANVTLDKDELNRIIDERVIEPIKNGELVLQTDERPHGEWIVDMKTRDVVCSCCRESRRDTRTTHIFFCNHCGADMRGGAAND